MYLPPLQPVANSDIRICGDVEIHPTASIASGVILQAAPNSKIIVGVDACIGMGTIITASGGDVVIADGATLGSGVLIVGQSQIGKNACVGTTSTIFNASVDAMVVISPGSILGDVSRSAENSQTTKQEKIKLNKADQTSQTTPKSKVGSITEQAETAKTPPQKDSKSAKNNSQNPTQLIGKSYFVSKNTKSQSKDQQLENQKKAVDSSDPWAEEKPTEREISITSSLEIEKIEKKAKVSSNKAIGKVYIDQLLVTLFPHKKHFNNNSLPE